MTPDAVNLIAQGTIRTHKRRAGRLVVAEGGVALLKKFETAHRNPWRYFAKLSRKIKTDILCGSIDGWWGESRNVHPKFYT